MSNYIEVDGLRVDPCMWRSKVEEVERLQARVAELEGSEMTCIKTLVDIRFACGDDGKRMQGELVEYIAELSRQAVSVPEWVSVIEDNCWDLRCVSRSTGGDDCDVIWQVIEHHMSEPNQRVIAESLYPLDALERALNPIEQEGE